MTTLTISLPNELARTSQEVAKKLGVSRNELIRQAIVHELEHLQTKFEQEAIIKNLKAMKNQKSYLEESEEIAEGLNANLPDDKDEWWNQAYSD